MIYKRYIDGVLQIFDTDEIAKEIEAMSEREQLIAAAKSGCFDCIVLIPAGEKKYESKDDPGWIETVKSVEYPGYYHPFDDEELPMFSVVLDGDGKLADAGKLAGKK